MNTPEVPRPASWGEHLGMALLLLVVALVFFGPTLAQGLVLAPGDGVAQYFPQRVIAAEAYRQGEIPFWNPYNFSGMPLLGAIQGGVLYPGNLPFLFLPPVLAMNVATVLAFWVAGVGTFVFGRTVGMTRVGALAAAVTFMLGGFMAVHVMHLTITHAAGLLPWMLWAIERFRQTLAVRFAVGGAALLGLQILAGHPQMTAYSLILVGAYALYRGFSLHSGHIRYFGHLAIALGLGVGLALMQLLPTLELIQASQRQAISFERLVWYSLPPLGLPTLLFPFLFGSRYPAGLLDTPFWGQPDWQYWTQSYVGLAPVLLAAVALLAARFLPQVRFWAAAAALALLLTLGHHTPLYTLWGQIPVVNMMPYPHRHNLEFTFAMGMLAGWGLTALGQGAISRARVRVALAALALALVAVIGAILGFGPGFISRTQPLMPEGIDLTRALNPTHAAFWLPLLLLATLALLLAFPRGGAAHRARGGHRIPAWRLAAVSGLLFADLFVFGQLQSYLGGSPKVPALSAQGPIDWARGRSMGLAASPYPYDRDFTFLRALGYGGSGTLDGLPTVNGYDAFILKRYSRIFGDMESLGYPRTPALWEPGHHAIDLLAMKELRLEARLLADPAWQARLASPRWKKAYEAEGVVAFENTRALPRAWRVSEVIQRSAEEVDAMVMRDPHFDPRQAALVESPVPAPVFSSGPATAETVSLNRIRLETSGAGYGYVVVSESYDPGWRAFSKGRELAVHRTDALLLGVQVPPGEQVVELRYEPRLWRAGLLGSTLALFALAAWGTLGTRRRRVRR